MTRTCGMCRWWETGINDFDNGLCHRYPPNITDDYKDFTHPLTSSIDFCGEWSKHPLQGTRTMLGPVTYDHESGCWACDVDENCRLISDNKSDLEAAMDRVELYQ